MDAIFGNFIKNATKYVADDFFRPHRNRFGQKFKPNASVNLRHIAVHFFTQSEIKELCRLFCIKLGTS